MATKKKKRMRLPNGIGSVHLINDGKRRRNPWRARVPSHVEINMETGKASQKYINIGYFPTETEAIEALFDYRKNPYTLEASTVTFGDVFEMWKAKKYPEVSASAHGIYNAAYKNSAPLHSLKMREIRSSHMEGIMQSATVGFQAQSHMRTLWGQLFKYAIEHDIVEKNYAQFITLKDKDTGTNRTAISDEDIKKIWQAIDEKDETAEIAMIYIYTGMRLSELLELRIENIDLKKRILVGGKKTAAGKNRRIPIHKCIIPFIEKRVKNNKEYLIEYNNKPIKSAYFSLNFWNKLMLKLDMQDYTVHYTRHTCATMLRMAGIEEDIRKLILGHSSQDITDRYTHHPDAMLIEAIDKLPGRA